MTPQLSHHEAAAIDLRGVPDKVLSQFSPSLQASLVALRRDLHQYPELAFQEERTCTTLERTLDALLADTLTASVRRVAGTGLVVHLRGHDPSAPMVAVRGDIDALPIREATGVAYASKNDGLMHACGHDVHAAWAVGAACLLAQRPAAGDVLVILQPAEETGNGAAAILSSGALDGVSAIFGAHVDRRFSVGQVVAQAGPLAAAADTFTITLRGRGAHGARPHESADPVLGAGMLIAALQGIVARRVNPAVPAVVTVATMRAGEALNIIPDSATIGGTLRTVDVATRALVATEVRRIAEGIAAAYQLEAHVDIVKGPPPIVNPEQEASWARTAASRLVGEAQVVPLGLTNMAGEDFADYMERIPGAFLRIGAREPDGVPTPAHSPQFLAAEGALFVGAAVLAEAARVASDALADEERAAL